MSGNTLKIDLQEAVSSKTVSAVLLANDGELVPVTPNELFHNDQYDFFIQDYVAHNGDVRGSNMFVPQGMQSPRWYIKPNAGDGEYREEQIVVSGRGWLRIFDIDGNLKAKHRLDAERVRADEYPVIIRPGDVFQVEADEVQDPRIQGLGLVAGVMVCAIFRQVPFDIGFEEKLA